MQAQGVQRLLRARQMQAKLAVSEPHDPLEQEADRVADEVMRMPEPAVGPADAISPRRPPSIQRLCSECEEELQREALAEEEEAPPIARKQENASSSHETSRTESLVSKLPGRGEPLPDSVRNFMEPRFGVDFSAVRVHTGPEAHRSTEEISALAYTAWNHIVFRAGQYDPLRESGKRLLAHELTHVLQQTRSSRAAIDSAPGDGPANSTTAVVSRAPKAVTVGERSATEFVATPGAPVAEERHGTVKEIDEMRATLTDAFRVRIRYMDTSEMIQEALRLDAQLWKQDREVGPREKSAIAETLIDMYHALDARIGAAPLDERGLPMLGGVKWQDSDPLAGIALAIAPFGNIDLWHTFMAKPERIERQRHRKPRQPRLQSFPVEEIVVPRPSTEKEPPDEFSKLTQKAVRDIEHHSSRWPKAIEGGAAVFHIIGGAVEQIGEESLGIALGGAALEIVGVFVDYVYTLIHTAAQRKEGGKLDGMWWTVLAAGNLDLEEQLSDIYTEKFYKAIKMQRHLQVGGPPSAYSREGGAMGMMQREEGEAEGIEKAVTKVRALMDAVEDLYRMVRNKMLFRPVPGDQPSTYQMRLDEWNSLRRAYKKEGFSFDDPGKEVRRLQHLALKKFLKEAIDQLQLAREERRE